VGDFFVDMLVENLVLVELKSVSTLNDDHMMQALNYLRASGLPACLLINFGTPKAQIRRLTILDHPEIPRCAYETDALGDGGSTALPAFHEA
jgi:hypothetical protein